MTAILAVAWKEFEDHLRNGWILSVALSFALFALVISFWGFSFTGSVEAVDQETALVSLTSLVIYLIPLLGLLLGYGSVTGERERGTLELLRSYPVDGFQIIGGKFLGLGAVMALTTALGLAAPGVRAVLAGGSPGAWMVFGLLTLWLGLIFLGLALLLSTLVREQGTVLALALAGWLLWVLLFDLGIIGLLVATRGEIPSSLVEALFHLNPTSLYRILNLQLLMGAKTLSAMGMDLQSMSPWKPALSLALWCLLPLWWGGRRFGNLI